MTLVYLVDADWAIDFLTNQTGARGLLPELLNAGTGLSIVTYIELYEGVQRSRNPQQAAREIQTLLQGLTILPLTRRVARRTAQVRGDLRAQKLPVQHRAFDLIVAATALTHDLTLVTGNTKDFQDISGLKRINHRTQR